MVVSFSRDLHKIVVATCKPLNYTDSRIDFIGKCNVFIALICTLKYSKEPSIFEALHQELNILTSLAAG